MNGFCVYGELLEADFTSGIFDIQIFQGIKHFPISGLIQPPCMIEKSAIVCKIHIKGFGKSCKYFFLSRNRPVFMSETMLEDYSVDYASKICFVAFKI